MSLLSNNLYKSMLDAKTDQGKTNRLATVTSISGSNIYIQFYGEDEASQKPYKRVSTYSASVGDVVMLTKIGSSYVITGKVV